jgi:hypothetical protein
LLYKYDGPSQFAFRRILDSHSNTDLMKLEDCSGERLRFTLRLTFTNREKGAVILDKRSSAVTQYMMSRNFKNAIKKSMRLTCLG